MAPKNQINFGGIARFALITSAIAAIVCFFAIPDQRWIAGLALAIGILDAVILGIILPGKAVNGNVHSELDRMNAEAEAASAADDKPVA